MMSLNRRSAIITVLAMPLAYFRAFAAEVGWLTVDLAKWKGIKVQHGPTMIELSSGDILKALTQDTSHE